MGFGPFLLGYIIEFICGLYGYGRLVSVLGYAVLLYGLQSLSRYCRLFKRAQWCTLPLALLAVYRTAVAVEELFGLTVGFVTPTMTTVVTWLDAFGVLAFHLFLSLALKELAMRVSLPRYAVSAIRDTIMVGIYVLLLLLAELLPSAKGYLPALALLAKLCFALLYSFLLLSCYMHIRPADETEEATPPPSRFAFVNRFRSALEKKEQKAIESDRRWHAERAQKRMDTLSKKQREALERKGKGNSTAQTGSKKGNEKTR